MATAMVEPLPILVDQVPITAPESAQDERQITIWKQEIRILRGNNRRARYEMGKRLAKIQKTRAKAGSGKFTTVDLPELRIGIQKAYSWMKFYRRIEARVEADLLQFAKAGIEDAEIVDMQEADERDAALDRVMEQEAERISALRNTKNSKTTVLQLRVKFATHEQRQEFKAKWRGLSAKVRWELLYRLYREVRNA